ncbi:hypothetical protein [Allocoleopsis franciscana]|uniref:Uncharacterized protein n=1 Tax=Allocoleopsis franciscana PCC 7113 TaxID=1173027 RepID=K9W9H9_9CYAN|nr:hypothetical protein [Allocoleopsis franciscana]AFZ16424.1 hypothetical protein Mic7113_0506 [Allocoleopsis franciscana PCC 7113]
MNIKRFSYTVAAILASGFTVISLPTPKAYAGCDLGDRLDPFNRNCPLIGPEQQTPKNGSDDVPDSAYGRPIRTNQELQQQGVNLYRTILGRDPEPGAAEGVASRLANGSTLARERQVMANSEESRNNLANLYRTILGREPEAGAVDGLVSRLANGSTLAQERAIMSNSDEARRRLGL